MPTLLLSNDSFSTLNGNEKSPLTTTRTADLVRQLEQGSIEAAHKLASLTEYKHDHIQGCYNCDTIANYYLMAFRFVRNNECINCDSLLLALVQQSIELIMCHVDVSRIQHLPWLPVLMSELRELGKQIKDESCEADRLVSLPNINQQVSYQLCVDDSVNGEYGRAIRISIYHCRAVLCEDMDTNKSISYYRKCVSVRPSRVETQRLQQSAKIALQHLITDEEKYAAATDRPRLPSRTSSVSSGASSSCSMACANCGVEKRGMPVCSKCKSQYYCGVRCLKAHKPVHDLECCSSSNNH